MSRSRVNGNVFLTPKIGTWRRRWAITVIRSGTQSGQRFRLRGKGVRNVRTEVDGDHSYTVQVTVPRVVSPSGREAARRVNELYTGAGDPRAGLPRTLD